MSKLANVLQQNLQQTQLQAWDSIGPFRSSEPPVNSMLVHHMTLAGGKVELTTAGQYQSKFENEAQAIGSWITAEKDVSIKLLKSQARGQEILTPEQLPHLVVILGSPSTMHKDAANANQKELFEVSFSTLQLQAYCKEILDLYRGALGPSDCTIAIPTKILAVREQEEGDTQTERQVVRLKKKTA